MPKKNNLDRDFNYYESTTSLCNVCMKTIPSKIIIKNNEVYILKYCTEHGEQLELLEKDAEYHKTKKSYNKPGTKMKIHTKINKGCPYDCGICPQHDQHACIGLIEITNACNQNCSVCYADSNNKGTHLPINKIEAMMDFFQESEYNKAEILQISGGEPTIHPDIIKIIEIAKTKNFKYILLNTNGKRIAEDENFVKELQRFKGGFEIYLQFDGISEKVYKDLRNLNLLEIKNKALKNLEKYKIPTTLVPTITNGINDKELGEIFLYALNTPYIRGINFQTNTFFGRTSSEETNNRSTISDIINKLSTQTNGMLLKDDFIPLPCNPERVAITYLYKSSKGSFIPITRETDIKNYLPIINNTFAFSIEDALKTSGISLKQTVFGCDCFNYLKDFKQIVPFDFFKKSKEEKIEYVDNNTFRISITSFIDKYNFDIRSLQKECVHVITEDLKKIPFSAYNMIHRYQK